MTDRGRRQRPQVAVLGLGYVGLPLAVRAAETGHRVVGYDPAAGRVAGLREGCSPVEDVSDDRLVASGLEVTTDAADLAGFDVAVITVPTPLRDGAPDLSHVEAAARTVAAALTPGAVVVLESTTYPGTTEHLVADTIAAVSGLRPGDYHLGFSPERIDPGNPTYRLENTPKIVAGVTTQARDHIDAFYAGLGIPTVLVSSPRVAELAKLLENTFRHVNIALVNEMAVLAHEMGVDVWEAIDAAATKPFGFMRFTPGPGVGGHCLPIDPTYLSWAVRRDLDRSFRFVELAVDVNNHMPDYVVDRAGAALNEHRKCLNGARVLVLGLAYKPGTGDQRESPALRIVDQLQRRGAAGEVCDPHVRDWRRTPYVDLESLGPRLEEVDLVVLVTDHPEFDLDKVAARAPLVLDCRNRVPGGPHVHRL
jgi:UDP-N-acetyl-D-glucosamine dehydrogenase